MQVIAEHLYQQGHFGVGDIFVREASVADGDRLKEPYVAMHSVLKQVAHTCMDGSLNDQVSCLLAFHAQASTSMPLRRGPFCVMRHTCWPGLMSSAPAVDSGVLADLGVPV